MKRIISALVITLVMMGLTTAPAKAADPIPTPVTDTIPAKEINAVSVSLGWYVYFRFNRSETYYIATRPYWQVSTALCTLLPAAFAAGCAIAGWFFINSVHATFKSANSQAKCVQIGFDYAPPNLPRTWRVSGC